MATNKHSEGATIRYTNAGADISSGDVVVVNNMICIAAKDIATGETGTLFAEGAYTVPKSAGNAINQGEKVIYDVSASAFVYSGATAATGDVSDAAVAWEDAAAGATSVVVKLCGPGTVA